MIPALFLAARPGSAQAAGTKQDDKAKPVEATAKNPAEKPVEIPLTGITSANSARVIQAVAAIEHSVYRCTSCNKVKLEKGQCCGKDTLAEKQKVADDVQANADARSLTLTIRAGHSLRLSDLESALKSLDVRVDRDKLMLPAHFELTVAGIPSKTSAADLEKAMKEGGTIEPLASEFDEGAKHLAVRVHAKAAPATYKKVAELLTKANASARVEDVTWVGPCPDCRDKGMKQASCPKCWPEGKTSS
jgi:hypothetical protein